MNFKIRIREFLVNLFHDQTLYWARVDLRSWIYRSRQWFSRKGGNKRGAVFLNVGCGENGIMTEHWFNVDAFPAKSVDLVWMFRRRLPFPDKRFKGIYSEHFFEHLTPLATIAFLRECLRILDNRGVLRLSVPDGELYLRKYWEDRAWMLERRGGRFRTPMEVVNEVFRQGFQHQYCFDYETLALWLRDAGFCEVHRVDYGIGSISNLLIDQSDRRFESLYVEARRP
jgi:predicted SAM-dependent methyltransferase